MQRRLGDVFRLSRLWNVREPALDHWFRSTSCICVGYLRCNRCSHAKLKHHVGHGGLMQISDGLGLVRRISDATNIHANPVTYTTYTTIASSINTSCQIQRKCYLTFVGALAGDRPMSRGPNPCSRSLLTPSLSSFPPQPWTIHSSIKPPSHPPSYLSIDHLLTCSIYMPTCAPIYLPANLSTCLSIYVIVLSLSASYLVGYLSLYLYA